MATYTPPPYFPQGSLAPPDKNRYRKFKLVIALIGLLVVLLLAGAGIAVWYLVKALF
jgi:flagellar basal body-associated protein FliL